MREAVSEAWRNTRGRLVRRSGARTKELERASAGLTSSGDSLGSVPLHLIPTETVQSVCGFCATGCSLTIHLRDGKPVNVTPTARYPVNLGSACPKGWEVLAPVHASDRMVTPLIRDMGGELRPVSWEKASSTFVDRMREVQRRHGAS